MKTKIINTMLQWAPEAVSLIPDIDHLDDTMADYQLLQKLAALCNQKMNSKSISEINCVKETTNVANLLYQGGNQYTRNVIENSFLKTLSFKENPGSLKIHLELLPAELSKGYLKTILEN